MLFFLFVEFGDCILSTHVLDQKKNPEEEKKERKKEKENKLQCKPLAMPYDTLCLRYTDINAASCESEREKELKFPFYFLCNVFFPLDIRGCGGRCYIFFQRAILHSAQPSKA